MHVRRSALAIIVPTSIRSFRAHLARGAVDMGIIRSWLIPVPVGVAFASFVAAYVSGAGLRAIFAGIAFIVALRLIFNRESWRLGTEVPHGPVRAFVGAAIGFLSTLMGIGGGVLSNTFMTVYGRPIHQARTAAGVGSLSQSPARRLDARVAGGIPPFSIATSSARVVIVMRRCSWPARVRIATPVQAPDEVGLASLR